MSGTPLKRGLRRLLSRLTPERWAYQIETGVTGLPFEGNFDWRLIQLFREREEAARSQESAYRLASIDARVQILIKSMMEEMEVVAQRGLPELISLVAKEPTAENRDAFYRALLVSRVGVRNPNPPRSIPTGRAPDGSPVLVVSCDILRLCAAYPRERFSELAARDVLKMARSAGGGVVVKNDLDGKGSWAAVPRDQVAEILARSND
jgi:hypothetical protein